MVKFFNKDFFNRKKTPDSDFKDSFSKEEDSNPEVKKANDLPQEGGVSEQVVDNEKDSKDDKKELSIEEVKALSEKLDFLYHERAKMAARFHAQLDEIEKLNVTSEVKNELAKKAYETTLGKVNEEIEKLREKGVEVKDWEKLVHFRMGMLEEEMKRVDEKIKNWYLEVAEKEPYVKGLKKMADFLGKLPLPFAEQMLPRYFSSLEDFLKTGKSWGVLTEEETRIQNLSSPAFQRLQEKLEVWFENPQKFISLKDQIDNLLIEYSSYENERNIPLEVRKLKERRTRLAKIIDDLDLHQSLKNKFE